jgi:SAM-dependent methyltransferase
MSDSSTPLFNYSAFEAFFRGSRQEIKERLSVYLELVNLVAHPSSARALDIGCGRGEWLEILKEQNITAEGIDSNGEFIKHCREKRLSASEADLFQFFEEESDIHYNIITGFHLFEHIPPEKHLWLLNAIFRRLAPGGVVIIETPNPENVTVGTCNFYIDPTHQRPVPPVLLHYLALQTGFSAPVIVRLNRKTVGTPLQLMAKENPDAALYNHLVDIVSSRLLQAPDYALIAFAPPSPSSEMLNTLTAINQLNDAFILAPEISTEPNKDILKQLHETDLVQELPQDPPLLKEHKSTLHSSETTTVEYDTPLDEYPESVRMIFHQLYQARDQAENDDLCLPED